MLEDGRKKIRRGDHSGRIESVDGDLLETLLAGGYTPVASPPMLADEGVAVNTDADRAAAAVAGSNDAEVGFELDAGNERVVVFSAIDNMVKGSAGQAVHAANVAFGFEETAGLEFPGLHPVGAP